MASKLTAWATDGAICLNCYARLNYGTHKCLYCESTLTTYLLIRFVELGAENPKTSKTIAFGLINGGECDLFPRGL